MARTNSMVVRGHKCMDVCSVAFWLKERMHVHACVQCVLERSTPDSLHPPSLQHLPWHLLHRESGKYTDLGLGTLSYWTPVAALA